MKKLIGTTAIVLTSMVLAAPAHAELFKWGKVAAKTSRASSESSYTLLNLGRILNVAAAPNNGLQLGVLNNIRPVVQNAPPPVQILNLGTLAALSLDANTGMQLTALNGTVDASLVSAGSQP